ncbi:MAG: ABC transporter substrate-binding protein [Lachnospiraceae bacterium]|nr:ABC transporter substrate-binding protein [Lachnospiraceae bacterium]
MRKKLITLLVTMALGCSMATVCSAEEGQTIVLTDNAGREVELPYPVESCVVALRYNNELIRACGAIDKVISVDMNTAQDREYWGMFDPDNVIGKSQRELDYEKIVELDPQVVILPANGAYEEAAEKLELFGIDVFVISGYDTADFENQVNNIGKMFAVEDSAQEFLNYFEEKLDYIDTQLEGVEKKTVYVEGTSAYSAILPGDPMYNMVEYAHADNIFSLNSENINAKEVDPEEVIIRNPDVIIKLVTPAQALAGTGLYEPPTLEEFKTAYQDIITRAGWDEITAVQNDDIYFMTQFSHGGAGKLVGTCYIAKMLYPDLLPDLDPEEVFRAWMEDFQGFKNVEGHFFSASDLK